MGGQVIPGATRSLSHGEKVAILKNHVAFLEEQIAEAERRIDLLVDDNAEMDFLADVNERARSDDMVELYEANVARIETLRREVAASREDIRIYRRVLAERFGVTDGGGLDGTGDQGLP